LARLEYADTPVNQRETACKGYRSDPSIAIETFVNGQFLRKPDMNQSKTGAEAITIYLDVV
ncbi:MAG: hypothetical protein ACREIT_11265, partial [Tepidisphaeraceae bacterium]